jgi:hypothetical protein
VNDKPKSSSDNDAVPKEQPYVSTKPTRRLDPSDLRPSWPIVVAYLEQLGNWSVLALRLGIVTLMQNQLRELAQERVSAGSIQRMRDLIEALAHLPCEER